MRPPSGSADDRAPAAVGGARLTSDPGDGAPTALARLAAEPTSATGLCTDFDGTISPVVVDADAARPIPGALDVLHALAGALGLVAVVSGRPAAFLLERLELERYRSPLRAVGLHGLEEARPDGTIEVRPGVAEWRPTLVEARDQLAATVPDGVTVEDKVYGVTVHWRRLASEQPARAAAASEAATSLVAELATQLGLVARPGKASSELVLPVGVDKGVVVDELCGGLARPPSSGTTRATCSPSTRWTSSSARPGWTGGSSPSRRRRHRPA